MKTYRSICFLLVAAFGVIASFAQISAVEKRDDVAPPHSMTSITASEREK